MVRRYNPEHGRVSRSRALFWRRNEKGAIAAPGCTDRHRRDRRVGRSRAVYFVWPKEFRGDDRSFCTRSLCRKSNDFGRLDELSRKFCRPASHIHRGKDQQQRKQDGQWSSDPAHLP